MNNSFKRTQNISILNSNICTTYRMDFCEEIKEYNSELKINEIYPHKSNNRINKILNIYDKFFEKCFENSSIPIFCIQELRTYNQEIFSEFFNKNCYKLILFPAYPNVSTENIMIENLSDENSINSDYSLKISMKRFSFINGIAIPASFTIEKEYKYYLSDNPEIFSVESSWGNCGSRICGGLEVTSPNGIKFKIFTTQFGMDVNERLKSSELLANIFYNEQIPVILTGDFNSFSNLDENKDLKGKEQIEILEKTFFRIPIDKGTFIGIRVIENENYCINLETGNMLSCLDHIFIKGNISVADSDIIAPETKEERIYPFSDHCMIWANLIIY